MDAASERQVYCSQAFLEIEIRDRRPEWSKFPRKWTKRGLVQPSDDAVEAGGSDDGRRVLATVEMIGKMWRPGSAFRSSRRCALNNWSTGHYLGRVIPDFVHHFQGERTNVGARRAVE
jgi:hypothetical protein